MVIDYERCVGCGLCQKSCPVQAIDMQQGKPEIGANCCHCGTCGRVCPRAAIEQSEIPGEYIQCKSCSVQCKIPPNHTGACKRYVNTGKKLVRNRTPVAPEPPVSLDKVMPVLFTGVGAGTTYPDYNPGAYIIEQEVDGIDVVTVVSEAPLSYSAMTVKIDTNHHIGDEGQLVLRDGLPIGMVVTEQYGSKMLSLGGVNQIKGRHGLTAARTIVEIASGEWVKMNIKDSSTLELKVGRPPVIDGKPDSLMRVGCGGAVVALFARQLRDVVDEAIILDNHVTGQFTKHPAGAELVNYETGVTPRGALSGPGRYFGKAGPGWGGTDVLEPRDAIANVNMDYAWVGMKILITETTGRQAALFLVMDGGELEQVDVPSDIQSVVDLINANCEPARVSAMFNGGSGGSARAGVTTNPILLTRAVHEGKARLTVGGAPAYVFPGGGINFLVDVKQMVDKPLTWIPTPAIVAPIEYTMEKQVYRQIGGHMASIRPLKEVLATEKIQITKRR